MINYMINYQKLFYIDVILDLSYIMDILNRVYIDVILYIY